jgi:sulfate adenylyltransferase
LVVIIVVLAGLAGYVWTTLHRERAGTAPWVKRGIVIWFTGLPGSGKSTLAVGCADDLERQGYLVDELDGDVVRTHLSRGLGFSREDRDENILRIGWVASRLARAGAIVLVSAISPYADARRRVQTLVESHGCIFLEVHVATPLEVCIRRDPKGLYELARAGKIAEFTGISSPYEEPENPWLRIDTTDAEERHSLNIVLTKLRPLLSSLVRGMPLPPST